MLTIYTLGVAAGRTQGYVEYTIEASRVRMSRHPWTGTMEYNVKGAIRLGNDAIIVK